MVENPTRTNLNETATKAGLISLRDDAIRLVCQGVTSFEEIMDLLYTQ